MHHLKPCQPLSNSPQSKRSGTRHYKVQFFALFFIASVSFWNLPSNAAPQPIIEQPSFQVSEKSSDLLAFPGGAVPQLPSIDWNPKGPTAELLCLPPPGEYKYRCCTQKINITEDQAGAAMRYFGNLADPLTESRNPNAPGCTSLSPVSKVTGKNYWALGDGVRLCGLGASANTWDVRIAIKKVTTSCKKPDKNSYNVWLVGGSAWVGSPGAKSSYVVVGRDPRFYWMNKRLPGHLHVPWELINDDPYPNGVRNASKNLS